MPTLVKAVRNNRGISEERAKVVGMDPDDEIGKYKCWPAHLSLPARFKLAKTPVSGRKPVEDDAGADLEEPDVQSPEQDVVHGGSSPDHKTRGIFKNPV